ncbi:MAG: EF-hand domain-containing protein [Chromatiales bacterium]|nr:EF-hand domain-containing protein [Chromatiales bacterium]
MKMRVCALLLAAAPLTAFAQQPSMAQMFMKQMDGNGDGKVTLEEFQKPTEGQFRKMDTNGDGVIDSSEAEVFATEMQQRLQQMRQQGGHGQYR